MRENSRFGRAIAVLVLLLTALASCGRRSALVVPAVPDAGPAPVQPSHATGAGNYAYPVVPANGTIGDLCSVGGSTTPSVCNVSHANVGGGGFVLKPGATPGGNQYADWPSLMAVYSGVHGWKSILFDDSLGAIHVTSGTWNVDATTFLTNFNGSLGPGPATLIFDPGAVFQFNEIWLDAGITFQQSAAATGPVYTLASGLGFIGIRGQVNLYNIGSLGTQPWGLVTGGTLSLIMSESTDVGDGTHNAFKANGSGFIVADLTGFATLGAHALGGTGTAFVGFSAAAGYTSPQDITTLTPFVHSNASRVTFTPQTSGNWPIGPPTLASSALDQIAAGGSGATPTTIYRPSGTAGGNIYTTWATAYSALHTLPHAVRTLVVDDNLGAAHMTSGGPYELDNVTFKVNYGSAGAGALIIDNGATISSDTHYLTFAGGLIVEGASSVASTVWSPTGGGLFTQLVLDDAVFENLSTTPLIHITDNNFAARTANSSAFGDGTHNVVTVDTGKTAISVLLDGGNATHAWAGAGTLTVFQDASSSTATQDIATVNLNQEDTAPNVAYTPGVPSDWPSQPSNVSLGLDTLASRSIATSGYNPTWYAFTDVYWDPVSGSDTYNSTSGQSGHPVKTCGEIVRRYGSTDPVMPYGQNLTIHLLSAQTLGTDATCGLSPKMSGGGSFAIIGTLTQVCTIAVNTATVTTQSRGAPGTRWQVSNMCGSAAAKNLLQDTTQNTWVTIDSIAGGTATVSQPLSNTLLTTIGLPTLAESTMSTNDAFTVWAQPLINAKWMRCRTGDVSSGGAVGVCWYQDLEVADSSTANNSEFPLVVDGSTVFSRTRFDTRVHVASLNGRGSAYYFLGEDVSGAGLVYSGSGGSFYGGIWRSGLATQGGGNPTISGDIVLHGANSFVGGGEAIVNNAFADGTTTVADGMLVATGPFWGSSPVSVSVNGAFWKNTGSSWVSTLLTSGTLSLGAGAATNGVTPIRTGTFTLNGTSQVTVSGNFPASSTISWSLNTVGSTAGTGSPYFSAANTAGNFFVKSPTASANDVYNWMAQPGLVAITASNLDSYGTITLPSGGSRFTDGN